MILVIEKVRDRLLANKLELKMFKVGRFSVKKINI
jgi:hypothetical protein